MGDFQDRLSAPAGACSFDEDVTGTLAPYYVERGLMVPARIGDEVPFGWSWWLPYVFRSVPRKVLRIPFNIDHTTYGSAEFSLFVLTYLAGDYEGTYVEDNTLIHVSFPDALHTYNLYDLDCSAIINQGILAGNDMIEVKMIRTGIFVEQEPDPLNAATVLIYHARLLSDAEQIAAYATGLVHPWL